MSSSANKDNNIRDPAYGPVRIYTTNPRHKRKGYMVTHRGMENGVYDIMDDIMETADETMTGVNLILAGRQNEIRQFIKVRIYTVWSIMTIMIAMLIFPYFSPFSFLYNH